MSPLRLALMAAKATLVADLGAALGFPAVFEDDVTLPFLERAREQIPGLGLVDAHTHIGANDPDGYRCSREELMEALERAHARAAVFPMHEPGGYQRANDMVLEQAEA